MEFVFVKLYGDDEGNNKVYNIYGKLQKLLGEYCDVDPHNQSSFSTIQKSRFFWL